MTSLRSARASVRGVTWLQVAEHGEGIPAAQAAGRTLPGLVLDLDATLITCHSEKQYAAPTYKGGFGLGAVGRKQVSCFLPTLEETSPRCSRSPLRGQGVPREAAVCAV
jgi:hypothetical protein